MTSVYSIRRGTSSDYQSLEKSKPIFPVVVLPPYIKLKYFNFCFEDVGIFTLTELNPILGDVGVYVPFCVTFKVSVPFGILILNVNLLTGQPNFLSSK